MLGSTFRKYFRSEGYNVSEFNRNDLDLARCSFKELSEKLIEKLSDCDYEYVLNCAGVIKQGKFCASDMIKVNGVIPHWLNEICKKNNSKLIHVTTDCVYDGKLGNYSEKDDHTANDVYGKSKSIGEPEDCTVVRTSIIGEEERGFSSLLEWVRSNKDKSINGFQNHIWNGVTCLQLAKIVDKIIKENCTWDGVRTFHSNSVNKFELVEMINEIYELNIKICPVSAADSCDRSLSTVHDISSYEIPDLYSQIKESKEFHIAHNED